MKLSVGIRNRSTARTALRSMNANSSSRARAARYRYPVLVHQAAALLRASFRPRLAAAPLRFANPSPSSGWIEDLHLHALAHARHKRKRPRIDAGLLVKPNAASRTAAAIMRAWS